MESTLVFWNWRTGEVYGVCPFNRNRAVLSRCSQYEKKRMAICAFFLLQPDTVLVVPYEDDGEARRFVVLSTHKELKNVDLWLPQPRYGHHIVGLYVFRDTKRTMPGAPPSIMAISFSVAIETDDWAASVDMYFTVIIACQPIRDFLQRIREDPRGQHATFPDTHWISWAAPNSWWLPQTHYNAWKCSVYGDRFVTMAQYNSPFFEKLFPTRCLEQKRLGRENDTVMIVCDFNSRRRRFFDQPFNEQAQKDDDVAMRDVAWVTELFKEEDVAGRGARPHKISMMMSLDSDTMDAVVVMEDAIVGVTVCSSNTSSRCAVILTRCVTDRKSRQRREWITSIGYIDILGLMCYGFVS